MIVHDPLESFCNCPSTAKWPRHSSDSLVPYFKLISLKILHCVDCDHVKTEGQVTVQESKLAAPWQNSYTIEQVRSNMRTRARRCIIAQRENFVTHRKIFEANNTVNCEQRLPSPRPEVYISTIPASNYYISFLKFLQWNYISYCDPCEVTQVCFSAEAFLVPIGAAWLRNPNAPESLSWSLLHFTAVQLSSSAWIYSVGTLRQIKLDFRNEKVMWTVS